MTERTAMSGAKWRVMCSPFLRGFLPGLAVGLSTALLFLSLWRHPLDPGDPVTKRAESSEPATERPPAERTNDRPELHRDSAAPGRSISLSSLTAAASSDVSGTFRLLVLVHSAAEQRQLRDAVRETWLRERQSGDAYVARFFVGGRALNDETLASLAEENERHGDLLVLETEEEESNAEWPSSRKLLHAFSWAMEHVNFTAIFKCNSATFVDMDRLLERVGQLQSNQVWGYFAGGVKAVRASDTSPLVEESWVLCSHYLPYPQGGGYLVSREIVNLIVDMGPDLEHYRHDDIALGVWLSPLKGIAKQHSLWFNTGHYSRGCLNSFVVSHRESVETMRAKAASLQTRGVLCETEYQSRLAYHFNWTAPASRCCVRRTHTH